MQRFIYPAVFLIWLGASIANGSQCLSLFDEPGTGVVIEEGIGELAQDEILPAEATPEEVTGISDFTRESLKTEMQGQNAALWRIAIQRFYVRSARFLQKNVTVSSMRSTEAVKNSNERLFEYNLQNGNAKEAAAVYRKVFDGVELSYFRLKQDFETLEKMRSFKDASWARRNLTTRLFVYQHRFSRHYEEYLEVRQNLERIIKEKNRDEISVKTAEETLELLGSQMFAKTRPDFAAFKIPETRPTIEEITALYMSRASFTRITLFYDFAAEVYSVFRYVASSEILISSIDSFISRFPPKIASILKKVTGIMSSAKLRFRYLNQILAIENLPEDNDLRYEDLRRKNAAIKNDDLLITFARTVDFTETWQSLKETAERKMNENEKNIIYADFYQRMEAAEKKALTMKNLSLFDKESNVDNLMLFIQAAIALKVAAPGAIPAAKEFVEHFIAVVNP